MSLRNRLLNKWAIGTYVCVLGSVLLVLFNIMKPLESAVLGVLILGCFAVYNRLPIGYSIAWQKQETGSRDGGRDEIVHLAWLLFGKDKNVSFGGMKRIREVTRNVLDSVGIDHTHPVHQRYLKELLSEAIVAALLDDNRLLTQPQAKRLTKFLTNIDDSIERHPIPPLQPVDTLQPAMKSQGVPTNA